MVAVQAYHSVQLKCNRYINDFYKHKRLLPSRFVTWASIALVCNVHNMIDALFLCNSYDSNAAKV